MFNAAFKSRFQFAPHRLRGYAQPVMTSSRCVYASGVGLCTLASHTRRHTHTPAGLFPGLARHRVQMHLARGTELRCQILALYVHRYTQKDGGPCHEHTGDHTVCYAWVLQHGVLHCRNGPSPLSSAGHRCPTPPPGPPTHPRHPHPARSAPHDPPACRALPVSHTGCA